MTPKFILLNALALFTLDGFCQQSPSVIAAAGGNGVTNELSLEWTIGEVFAGSSSDGSTLLTQGFEQPLLLVSNLTPMAAKPVLNVQSGVYPNPVTNVLNVKTNSPFNERVNVALLDLQGKILVSTPATSGYNVQQISMEKYPAGIYLLRVTTVYGALINTYRIVKAK